MKNQYDKHKRDLIFQKDDLVLLKTTHITMEGKRKFLPRYLVVDKAIGSHAYKLKLPSTWRIHDVFNVSLLKPWHARTLNSDNPEPPPAHALPDILDDFSVAIEAVTDHKLVYTNSKRKKKKIMYRVHFQDTAKHDDTWEYLKNIPEVYHPIVSQYHNSVTYPGFPPFGAGDKRYDKTTSPTNPSS